jgi:hypothetical protein
VVVVEVETADLVGPGAGEQHLTMMRPTGGLRANGNVSSTGQGWSSAQRVGGSAVG